MKIAELIELEKAIERGDASKISFALCLAFHEIYSLTIDGNLSQENKYAAIELFQRAVNLRYEDKDAVYLERIADRNNLLSILFSQGDLAVHAILRKRVNDSSSGT